MPGKKVACQYCSRVMRSDNLKNHVKIHGRTVEATNLTTHPLQTAGQKRPLNVLKKEPIYSEIRRDMPIEIPTFDGDEFSGKKSKSRDTLYRMAQMLKIPEHSRKSIVTDILKDDRNKRVDLSNSIDKNKDESNESEDEEEDYPLTETEIEELRKRFKSLHYDLLRKGHRENIGELLDMLNVLFEGEHISQADYIKTINRIKNWPQSCASL